jgi:phosphoribosyl-ATP pyrophosphohydrolase/phosphoribosyl-AMP cyclohydrolase
MSVMPADVRFGPDGLVPAIVQDVADGRVLMLAWMDAEALDATVASGEVHFHSRSRDRLWRKGETSGNVLRLRSIAIDCDADALLLTADPAGPTCHRGTRSCFDPEPTGRSTRGSDSADPTAASTPNAASTAGLALVEGDSHSPLTQGFAWLENLWATIAQRAADRPAGSYTAELLDGGVDAVGRKVVEEATEIVLAAKDDAAAPGDRGATQMRLAEETADLLYHALVLLAERGLEPARVIEVLRARVS